MTKENKKSVVILKNLPSNIIEEAIMVVKEQKKLSNKKIIKALQDEKFNSSTTKNSVLQGNLNEEELKKIKSINKEDRKYIIKEAEMVVSSYLEKIDNEKKDKKTIKLQKKYKISKKINIGLAIFSLIVSYICIMMFAM